MSMSSLSAQLASINTAGAGGKNPGSSLSTSKRHEDAVGRGLAHSATHGHVLASASPHFKPSVLYADSKAASDVPLTTLRENCVSSLRQLAKLTENDAFVRPQVLQTLVGAHSLSYERGLSTRSENDKLDLIIVSLLSLLSTSMGESSSACFSSSLHVIEYLLRRYDIHARSNTADRLIVATLPHHEQPVFSRVLQLIDLASMPTWAFLRPYAAKGSPPPTRTALAKRAARDNALLVHCCELAKVAANLHVREILEKDNNINGENSNRGKSPRKGVSRIISFATAVILEALPMQALNPNNNGSVSEPTLRCILPFVLSACGDNSSKKKELQQYSLGVTCSDWRGFGHVLAAAITERCVLSEDARQVLATTLVQGSLESDQALMKSMGTESNTSNNEDSIVELAADSILVVMSVLARSPDMESNALSQSNSSHLSMIGSSNQQPAQSSLGYNLPHATFRALSKHERLSQALGHLHAEREISVVPLLASLLAVALSKLSKESSKKNQSVSASFQLILDLIREDGLSSAWTDKEVHFTAAFAAALLTCFAKLEYDAKDVPSDLLDSFRSVLKALKAVDPSGCDAGIAHTVTSICGPRKRKGRNSQKKRIALLLGLPTAPSVKAASSDSLSDEPLANEFSSAHLLPTRVALEHPEASIRLGAIKRVLKEGAENDIQDGESLENALVRRMNVDDDAEVAAAAGNAIQTLLHEKCKILGESFANMAIGALHKWCLLKDDFLTEKNSTEKKKKTSTSKGQGIVSIVPPQTRISDNRIEALESALTVAAYAAQSLIEEGCDASSNSLQSLVQAIAAHIDFQVGPDATKDEVVTKIAESASTALVIAIKSSAQQKKKGRVQLAKTLLVSNDLCSQILRSCCSSAAQNGSTQRDRSTHLVLQRRYFSVVLTAHADCLEKSKQPRDVTSEVLSATLYMLSSFKKKGKRKDINEDEAALLLRCLQLCGKRVSIEDPQSIPATIISLASVSSLEAYNQVCLKSIPAFCDSIVTATGARISPVSVLMESTSRFDVPDEAVKRLLDLASKYVTSEKNGFSAGAIYAVVPTLMQLGHADQVLRRAALDLLARVGENLADGGKSSIEDDHRIIRDICKSASADLGESGVHSSIIMDGAQALPKLLCTAMQNSSEPAKLREYLLRYCVFATFAKGAVSDASEESITDGWLPFGQATGGCRGASIVLNALELAGEAAFPLSLRWQYAGKVIFNAMVRLDGNVESSEINSKQVAISYHALIDTVVRMLKGVTVHDASSLHNDMSSVVISTGPSRRGTRMRSYSVGKSDGVSFIEAYPECMQHAITEVISPSFCGIEQNHPFAVEMCDAVMRNVLGSRSWGDGIFKKLPTETRKQIASSLLCLRSTKNLDSAGMALLGLPLTAPDVSTLLKDQQKENDNLPSITFLADWIRANYSNLARDPGIDEISSLLYDLLAMLSSDVSDEDAMDIDDIDASEFARSCILQTLLTLSQASGKASKTSKKSRKEQKDTMEIVSLLVRLVGSAEGAFGTESSIRPLLSGKAKSVALTLLTTLCSQQPTAVVASLIPALLTSMVSLSSIDGELARASSTAGEALSAVVPVYCQYAAAADLSVFHLLKAFMIECQKLPEDGGRLKLYGNLVDAFASIPRTEESWTPVGTLIAAFMANETFYSRSSTQSRVSSEYVGDGDRASAVSFALNILQDAPATLQVASLLQLLRCVRDFADKLGAAEKDGDQKNVDFNDIEALVLSGPEQMSSSGGKKKSKPQYQNYNQYERRAVMRLVEGLLAVVLEALSIGSLRKSIKTSDSSESALCLRLWQEMLQVQATAADAQSLCTENDRKFWESSRSTIDETLEYLQNLLPAHLFLASATALITEESADGELRGKAVRLLAERASEADPNSAEAALFLDMVPIIVDLLDGETNIVLMQSALIAIEHIARSLCLSFVTEKDTKVFFTALEKATGILNEKSSGMQISSQNSAGNSISIQLICSAALCTTTLVRVLKARCLPLLNKLAAPLLESLCSTNVYLLSNSDSENQERVNSSKVLQLSILRALVAIADTLPQFLVPYLGQLLSPSALPATSLRVGEAEQDLAVKSAAESLENILSTRTPARQLIPAACKALVESKENCLESSTLLSILKISIQSSSRAELASLRSWVLKALIIAYEHKGIEEDQATLLFEANEMMLSLVLKLSEAQLRPLYAKLREWRGEAKGSRQLAFWSLSAVLSRELRAIFLPCLSTVVADAVDELEFAVSKLCVTKSSEKIAGGKKKRRLASSSDDDAGLDSNETLRALQPLLLCLESALKADAHEGGTWVRADDGERFNSLLSPLGKLLQCKVTIHFPLSTRSENSKGSTLASPFQKLVQGVGTEECGNVVSCVTALASAAGNEQLWKPLNHKVLDACGNESRSEVRKGGVSCLLSLIKALGEEYMVLLPECLPVLSELLEDGDEEIASLAQECVSLGEDLLGESLQDSLR